MSTDEKHRSAWLPPRWFIRAAWWFHRRLYAAGGARFLRRPTAERAGMLRLTTTGRRTGQERSVIVSYVPDGSSYVTLAMNGWADPPPAWWLNLLANPDAVAETVEEGTQRVRAREATGPDRERLWGLLAASDDGWGELDDYAVRRSHPTPVVVLELSDQAEPLAQEGPGEGGEVG
ncbi:nitroreductase/quinone reductase family protein [Nocardioides sp. NPDC101246]|uniref:nitroreductase/quinone reductase family protein n=1 Tax=Nocardioides sp. NPDC101246 TaxID=3364336 RepID=UPI0038270EC7